MHNVICIVLDIGIEHLYPTHPYPMLMSSYLSGAFYLYARAKMKTSTSDNDELGINVQYQWQGAFNLDALAKEVWVKTFFYHIELS